MENVYDGELGKGEGEAIRVVPGTRLGLVAALMEELLDQAGGMVLNMAVGDKRDSSDEVILDVVVIVVLDTGGGL
jgi:hypothetical protein